MDVPLVVAWVLVAPFAVMAAVRLSPALQGCLLRWYRSSRVLGWAGFSLVVLGAFVLPGHGANPAIFIGAPLTGLCVWVRREGEVEEASEPPPETPPDPDEPPDGEIDWDRFMRELEEWSSATRTPR